MQPQRVEPVPSGSTPARLAAAPRLLRAWPHLPGFWPGSRLVSPAAAASGDPLLLPAGDRPPPGWAGPVLRLSPGPFAPPRLAGRSVPPILLAAEDDDPIAVACAGPVADLARAAALRPLLRAARCGAPPGLDDPGPRALGLAPGEGVILVDPCDPARAMAAEALRAAARAAGGRRLVLLRDPFAPAAARPLFAETRPGRLSPWTLIDAAAALHALPGPMALLARLAGVAAEGGEAAGLACLAKFIAAARCADPVSARAILIEDALVMLAAWRAHDLTNRAVAACLGMSFWKRRRIRAALASEAPPPAFVRSTGAALAEAARRGGEVAVWAARAPADLVPRARAAGIRIVWVEDGFLRSAGLGAGFLPGASLALDRRRPHFDPRAPGELEILLATAAFPPALLARAAALRAALVARGITKYNLAGAAPVLPAAPGRPRILVPGQVEDDLSVRLGATGGVRTNLDLLRAVRAARPDAFIAYKPHPDVEAGFRRGAIPPEEARRLADIVLDRAPIAPLLSQVDQVQTITSLTGFEALLRGVAVTCWGRPFYAGWGLTEDRAPIPRRARRLSLDELVAGALILYPRYLDPVTELPCEPEALLDRLSSPAPWRGGIVAALRRWQGAAMARLARGRG
ncbi:capsular biosynthesis protein [Roseomonas sp. PWR1]|uniref:Capsular biosynthesis protein n=1 Tax=Roseomonas nitratireducens TaxID=2820810 RepID=A0ABS4AZQ9_9PROT|nr:capsular biosynthesis protein [Neoroseomonas nitratireducens]MBP0466865.1 capsular biosynthesis protein [Neoroseomonas nitratireducens]